MREKSQKIKSDAKTGNKNSKRKAGLSEKTIADALAYVKRYFVEAPKTGGKLSSSAMKAEGVKSEASFSSNKDLDNYLKQEQKQNESFAKYLTKQLEERGLTFKELCKSLDFDRKRVEAFEFDSSVNPYRPIKNYVILMGLKMQMDIEGMLALLSRAGYTLSYTDKKDLVIRYCIKNKIYDCFKVDDLVYEITGKSLKKTRSSEDKKLQKMPS